MIRIIYRHKHCAILEYIDDMTSFLHNISVAKSNVITENGRKYDSHTYSKFTRSATELANMFKNADIITFLTKRCIITTDIPTDLPTHNIIYSANDYDVFDLIRRCIDNLLVNTDSEAI